MQAEELNYFFSFDCAEKLKFQRVIEVIFFAGIFIGESCARIKVRNAMNYDVIKIHISSARQRSCCWALIKSIHKIEKVEPRKASGEQVGNKLGASVSMPGYARNINFHK